MIGITWKNDNYQYQKVCFKIKKNIKNLILCIVISKMFRVIVP